jgi:hypothetical protein
MSLINIYDYDLPIKIILTKMPLKDERIEKK